MSLNQYKKILVIKHGSLGDITFALSAMNSIRFYFKYSKITLLTDSKFVNFLKLSEIICNNEFQNIFPTYLHDHGEVRYSEFRLLEGIQTLRG